MYSFDLSIYNWIINTLNLYTAYIIVLINTIVITLKYNHKCINTNVIYNNCKAFANVNHFTYLCNIIRNVHFT